MSSANDIVWLALHAGELTRKQLDELDLTQLRSFEPRGMGYSVELFKSEEEPPSKENEVADAFIEALNNAASVFGNEVS